MAAASAITTEIARDIEQQLGSTHAQPRAILEELATITPEPTRTLRRLAPLASPHESSGQGKAREGSSAANVTARPDGAAGAKSDSRDRPGALSRR